MPLFGGGDKKHIEELENRIKEMSATIAHQRESIAATAAARAEADRILSLHRKEVKIHGVRLGTFRYSRAEVQAMLRGQVDSSITVQGDEECNVVVYADHPLDEAAWNGLQARLNFRLERG